MESTVWNYIEAVFFLEIGLEPFIVLFKVWNYILKSLLVSDLVIEHIFDERKKRNCNPERVVFIHYRLICGDIVLFPDVSVLLLALIKIIHHGIWRIELIGIHQKQ